MTTDPILEQIVNDLRERHGCHTVILYGSRARAEETATSDYDLLGVRPEGPGYRDARLWNGVYLDLFIHPESKILEPDKSLLYMLGGRVLFERGDLGTRFLEKLQRIFDEGPEMLPADEIEARKTWAAKSLQRIRAGKVEGHFRRCEFIPAYLEDYFVTRRLWYRGPKQSLRWLKANRPRLYAAFEAVLEPGAPYEAFEVLVREAEISAP